MKPTKEIARRILSLLDHGLVRGLGHPEPGKMCVEAAVCFAFDLPHSDNPPCVGSAVRAFKIRLNDANWSSNKARAAGLRRIAIAQLGSNEIDQNEFRKRIAFRVIKEILPIGLRARAKSILLAATKTKLEQAASECEAALDLMEARKAASAAYCAYAASAAAAASAYAASAASAAAADAAAADAASAAAYAASASASAYAASAAAADAAYCAYCAYASYAARDEVLTKAADIAVEVLVELNSPGCQWLDLCKP